MTGNVLARARGRLSSGRLTWLRRHLDRPGRRWLLGAILAGYLTWLERRPALVRYHDGNWVHWQSGTWWVAPEPVPLTPRQLDAFNRDHFFYGYTPSDGDTVIDVGAGFGSEVLTCSKLVGPTGRVVVVEAEPNTYACLRLTCEKNRLDNVVLVNAAVADEAGLVRMTGSEDYVTNEMSRDVGAGVAIPAITLDALLASLAVKSVDFLKMNIEGAEVPALRATDALSNVRHATICCHDFRAELEGKEYFRTADTIRRIAEANQFTVLRRTDDPRTGIRDTLYLSRG